MPPGCSSNAAQTTCHRGRTKAAPMAPTTTAERCRKKSSFYHRRFSDVAPMSSEELLELRGKCERTNENDDGEAIPPPIVLVDARSAPERNVSMIPGAASLPEFEQDVVKTLPPDTTVVVYCTIGYRSGLSARRIGEKHGLEGRIRNLDGIVSYTHAVGDSPDESIQLINSKTGERTDVVHIFGPTWNCVHAKYKTVNFNVPELALRSCQVGLISALRFSQHFYHKTSTFCNCAGKGEQNKQVVETKGAGRKSMKPMEVKCKNAQFM